MRITFRHLLTMSSGLAWDETRKQPGDPANSWTQMIRANGVLFATGEPAAASGLRLRPRDTAKLGQLILADGIWGDKGYCRQTGWQNQPGHVSTATTLPITAISGGSVKPYP